MVTVRARRARQAFTLVEVLVVFVVLGITAALGFESMQATRSHITASVITGYQDRVITAEQSFYNQYGSFTQYSGDLTGLGRDLSTTSYSTTNTSQVSIAVGATSGNLALASPDGAGSCLYQLITAPTPSTTSATTTTLPTPGASASCNAANALSGEVAVPVIAGGTVTK